MTPESQRIAIAQLLFPDFEWLDNGLRWRNPENGHEGQGQDYLNDLNAMHEAENWYFWQCKTVDEKSLWLDYLATVCGWKDAESLTEAKFISDLHCSRATAAQRAEAFLRTLGLWKD